MGTQAQGLQVLIEAGTGPLQGFRMVGEQGQVVDITQVDVHARQGTQRVVEVIEVQVGQKLAGEVADRQATGLLLTGN